MAWRLSGPAERHIYRILSESVRDWGIEAADPYGRLFNAAMQAVAEQPDRLRSREVPRSGGIRVYPLRLARQHVAPEYRVGNPRHLIIYKLDEDGMVLILGVAHDRMLINRAARRLRNDKPER